MTLKNLVISNERKPKGSCCARTCCRNTKIYLGFFRVIRYFLTRHVYSHFVAICHNIFCSPLPHLVKGKGDQKKCTAVGRGLRPSYEIKLNAMGASCRSNHKEPCVNRDGGAHRIPFLLAIYIRFVSFGCQFQSFCTYSKSSTNVMPTKRDREKKTTYLGLRVTKVCTKFVSAEDTWDVLVQCTYNIL